MHPEAGLLSLSAIFGEPDTRPCDRCDPHRHRSWRRAVLCANACNGVLDVKYRVWRHAFGPWVVEASTEPKPPRWMKWDRRRPYRWENPR